MLTLSTASEGINLQAIAHRLGVNQAKGHVGFQASGTIPLATVTDLRTYQAAASVQSSLLECEGMLVQPLSFNAQVENGNLELTLPQATVSTLRIADRPTECLANQLQLADTLLVQSRLTALVPIVWIQQPEAWTVAANLELSGLTVANETISDFKTSCHLTGGSFGLSPCVIRWRDTVCSIAANGDLRDKAFATVQFTATPVPLRHLGELASRFSQKPLHLDGTASASGNIHVNLQPFGFTAAGGLTLADAWYERTSIGNAQFSWKADPQALQLQSGSQDFLGGSYLVDATLRSLDWTQATVTANCRGIQLKRLASMGGSQLPVTGTVDGSLRFASIADLQSLQADGWVATQGASFKGAPIQITTEKLNLEKGLATAALRGSAFDGSLHVQANTRLADLTAWIQDEARQMEHLPVFGQVEVQGIGVTPVLDTLSGTRSHIPLKGSVSLACVRDQAAPEHGTLATVVCSGENLRWNRALLSRRVQANATLYPTQVRVSSIEGKFADGTLSGDADIRIAATPTGTFRFNADNVNLRRACAPSPGLAKSVTGSGSVAIFGRIGNLTSVSAKVRASNVMVGDLIVREVRIPLDASYHLQSARVLWNCRGGAVKLGGGNVVVNTEGGLTNGLATMNSSVNFRNIDSARLLRGNSVDAGIISGHVNLQAKRARRPEDLSGQFHIELAQIQSLKIPGTESLTQLIKMPTVSLPSPGQEDGGTIDGRMAGGLLRIDSLTLAKSGMLVLMDGSSTLDGRLDLNVVAYTSQDGPADKLLSFADSPVMLAVSAPVALVAKANEAMKDRTIHVHVGGTSARPTVRLQPAKSLSQDALRFFVAGTLGSPVANIATNPKRQPVR